MKPHHENDSGRRPRLSVIGTGYLGATHAVCMASLGFEVIGLDIERSKIARLSAGQVPFYEPGLSELLAEALDSGRLRFTTSFAEVGAFADVHFVCVGTPQAPDGGAADISHVENAIAALATHLRPGALVVGKSTVPVGTAARMAGHLAQLAPVSDVALAWNPEFLREGFAVEDTLRPDRLIFGVDSAEAEATLREVYAPIIDAGCPVLVTNFATAELVKVAANSFLATKISFINAMAEICESTDGDVIELSRGLGFDPRIGSRFLHPGLGFGGGCLPKDIRAFAARAEELGAGAALSFLAAVDAINMRCRTRIVDLCTDSLGGSVTDRRICVLGAAFKPDSDDVRDSPALHVAVELKARGAHVEVYDPEATHNAVRAAPQLSYARSVLAAAAGADLVLVVTEWDEFRVLDPVELGRVVEQRHIVDGRHCLSPADWIAAGWDYRAPGANAQSRRYLPAPAAAPTIEAATLELTEAAVTIEAAEAIVAHELAAAELEQVDLVATEPVHPGGPGHATTLQVGGMPHPRAVSAETGGDGAVAVLERHDGEPPAGKRAQASAAEPARARGVARHFRPDIEGLRAVAVLLVVIYHAKLGTLSGGFVGVDVFFVISGFLITRQLFESQERRGRISLCDFYVRRMKRLLPAATVVMLATLVAARLWTPTIAAKHIAQDVFFSAIYGMNVHLEREGTDYLNANAAPSPLQHFWSLSVEEQFYLGLPLLILALALIPSRHRRRALTGVLAAVVIGSLYLSIQITASSATEAYFSITTRAWELGLGGLVAMLAPTLARIPNLPAAAASWAGLAMIFYSAFAFDSTTAFPGSAALLPVGGAALVVAAGGRLVPGGAEVLLGRWIAQMIGRISYSLYLWHWPVLIFAPFVVGRQLDTSLTLQALFVAVMLAVITYFHVEVPFRYLRLRRPAWVVPGLGVSAATAAAAVAFVAVLPSTVGTGAEVEQVDLNSASLAAVEEALGQGLLTRAVPRNLTPSLEKAPTDYQQAADCFLKFPDVDQPGDCVFGDTHGDRTMVLFGDSHAGHWFGAFDKAAKERGWRIVFRGKAACPVAKVSVYAEPLKRAYTECDEWRAATVADIVELKPDLIVASQADSVIGRSMPDQVWADGTLTTLKELRSGGAPVVFLTDIPARLQAPNECLGSHLDNATRCVATATAGRQYWPTRHTTVGSTLRAGGFTVVDPTPWVCLNDRCPPIVGNILTYRDTTHVTNSYSTWLAPVVAPLLAAAEGP